MPTQTQNYTYIPIYGDMAAMVIPFVAHDRPIRISIYSGLSIVMAINQGVCRETAILLGDS